MPTWPDDPYDALDEIVRSHGMRIVKTWFTQIEMAQSPTPMIEPEPELEPVPGWDE
jgi:hypothetical protein